MVFPVLLVMMLGVFDFGQAIMCNQKTIKASQVVADLVTRNQEILDTEVDDAIDAGTLSLMPYNDETLGFDIISIRFLDDATPEIVWQETRNMTASTLPEIQERTLPLAEAGSGVVMVISEYDYRPVFAGFVADEIPMQEVAFARGRRSAVVCKPGATGC